MEFPLSWTDLERRGGDTWTPRRQHLDACPVHGVPPQLDGSEHRGGDTWARALWSLDACPVEFPLSLTDSERCGGDTWARALWMFPLSLTARHTRATHANALRTLCERFADALTTIADQRLDPWTPTFKTRTLLLRIREKAFGLWAPSHKVFAGPRQSNSVLRRNTAEEVPRDNPQIFGPGAV